MSSNQITERLQLLVPRHLGGREPDPSRVPPDWEQKKLIDVESQIGMDIIAPDKQIASATDMAKLTNVGFKFGEKLGEGSFGLVYKTEFFNKDTGFHCFLACKRVSLFVKSAPQRRVGYVVERLKNEMAATQILASTPHDNVLQTNIIIRFFYPDARIAHPYNQFVFMNICDGDLEKFISVFCQKTTSYQDINGLPENDCKKLAIQLLSGVDFLHNAPKRPELYKPEEQIIICHCDIKPENIFFTIKNSRVTFKLADFGFAQVFYPGQEVLSNAKRGTPSYFGKERNNIDLRINPDGYDPRITMDIYAVGVTVLECWIGYTDKPNDDKYNFVYQAQDWMDENSWDELRERFETLEDEMYNFVSKCCAFLPEDRYSVVDANNDPWLDGVEQVDILHSVFANVNAVEGFYDKQKERQPTIVVRSGSQDRGQQTTPAKGRKRFVSE